MRTMSWAFPAIKRSCVVEEITLVTAPLIPVHEEPATDVPDWLQPSYVPDWTRRTDTSIRRMRRWRTSRRMVGKVLRDRASSGLDDHEPTFYLIERDGPGRLALGSGRGLR